MGKFRIEILDKDFPYEELTELLHASYKEHLDAGRKYMAAVQTVEDTERRLDGRLCAVAYNEENKLVACITGKVYLKGPNDKRKWYEDDNILHIEQMAVHPDYRDTNILTKMVIKSMKLDFVKSADSWMTDTSVEATNLVNAYVKMGFQIVDMVSWESTNYYSYVFRKPVKGKKYSDRYTKFRATLSILLCKIRYTKEGKRRF